MEGSYSNELVDQLPTTLYWDTLPLYKLKGYWYSRDIIQGMFTLQSHFKPNPNDIILASSMKTGTTWLKALASCILESKTTNIDQLEIKNPHTCVKTLEVDLCTREDLDLLSHNQSPQLFHTHLPYNSLPNSIKGSKMVYLARNPKDTLVSTWHFYNKIWKPYPLEKAYEEFCKGVHVYGPFFDHVLEYWLESLNSPNKLLFLKYEDLKRDPKKEVRKLGEFLGRLCMEEDEVDEIVRRTRLERLKNLEVNKNGVVFPFKVANSSFFRVGVVGDWRNYLSEEMEQGIDEICRVRFQGFGLHFDS